VKNRTYLLLTACLMAMVSFTTAPSLSQAESLKSAVTQALEHAPSLLAAQAARDASNEDMTLGRAWLLPYVVANGSLTRIDQDSIYSDPKLAKILSATSRNNQRAYSVKAYQPLFDVAKWAIYQQGKISAATGELKLRMQRQKTILETSAAWLSVMRAQAAFTAAKASEQAMAKLAMQAKMSFDVGTVAVNDSLAAQSRRDLATVGRIRAGQVLDQAKALLYSLVGHTLADKQDLVSADLHRGLVTLRAKPDDLKTWEQQAETGALAVRLSEQSIAMADAAHLQAIGAATPKVQLVATWGRDKNSDGIFGGSAAQDTSIGIEFSMPLYAGGSTWAKQRKSTKERLQAEFEREEAKRTARLTAQQSLLSLRTTAAEVAALNVSLRSAELEKKAAQAGFDVGVRTITEALDAEERLAAAKQNYADAVARHAMAYLQLIASTGKLNVSSVAKIDRLFVTQVSP